MGQKWRPTSKMKHDVAKTFKIKRVSRGTTIASTVQPKNDFKEGGETNEFRWEKTTHVW